MNGKGAFDARTKLTVRRLLSTGLAVFAAAFLIAPPAAALAPPTPREFVSNLDLECFRTTPYQPPAIGLLVRHINPVLANQPPVQLTLGPREQLCVPVAKNNVIPPPGVLDYVRFVDLSCYRVAGPAINQNIGLRHLNPVLQNQPGIGVTLTVPQQLCVPVIKNGVIPPADVVRVVRHIDLLCYAHTPNPGIAFPLTLTQLNPVLTGQIPVRSIRVTNARQLCVPVQKAGDDIPPDVFNIVRWVDLEKFDIAGPAIAPVTLNLRHINPVLGNLPPEQLQLTASLQLAVPVAKNGIVPPG
ncbi:hypothetical protein SAMN05444920_106244 [Nonomuraea solani]|uniref:Uncharacterized protein n=1 Tax=Nonomuraea solani TaxID=1144553 RepID=A0A1H6DUS5_9ACTN|nr:hypothetical protein [Nonomuraea solani]SEG88456.1 hypothetical protein SAMN05444920_106244 [Nonomuraea solani]